MQQSLVTSTFMLHLLNMSILHFPTPLHLLNGLHAVKVHQHCEILGAITM